MTQSEYQEWVAGLVDHAFGWIRLQNYPLPVRPDDLLFTCDELHVAVCIIDRTACGWDYQIVLLPNDQSLNLGGLQVFAISESIHGIQLTPEQAIAFPIERVVDADGHVEWLINVILPHQGNFRLTCKMADDAHEPELTAPWQSPLSPLAFSAN